MPAPSKLCDFTSYEVSLPHLLDNIGATTIFQNQSQILIKPNLVNTSPPPVTLPVEAVKVLVSYIRRCSRARIIIGEGTGMTRLDSMEIFRCQGYERLAKELDLQLVDLNEAENILLKRPGCLVFPELHLPKLAFESFIISFAVLKAHSLAEVTLSMKNMMGFPSHHHYQHGGQWRKSAFHARMHRSIFELNLYRKPDLSLIDASIGLAEYHLGGPTCNPPVNKLVGGFDPVAVDAAGSELLGFSWQRIEHIRLANGVLGHAFPEFPGDLNESGKPQHSTL